MSLTVTFPLLFSEATGSIVTVTIEEKGNSEYIPWPFLAV
jgi:hypothetical protein